jgi:tetratricopeptide (TPR) repeat protein
MFRTFTLLLLLVAVTPAVAQRKKGPAAKAAASGDGIHTLNVIHAPAAVIVALDKRLPLTKLAPAKVIKDLCHYKYRVTTASPECQAFVDQSLGYYYSYVWMEAARSAETALRHDPECAYAWFILHRAIEKWGKGDANKPLEKAKELLPKAGPREQLLIQSKLQEKGMWPGVGPDDRKKKAAASLDELLTLYGDDEEGWFARAQLNGGTEGVVYYKALLRINPIHPGASHELVHFYEGYKRPALGWPFAEAYIASSPGIPHAFHMQAHLATRIGKWAKTTDWSAQAVALQKAYHKEMNIKVSDDWQFDHHLETLTRSLIHDGRIAEAVAIHDEIDKNSTRKGEWPLHWFLMYRTGHDWDGVAKLVAETRKSDKATAAYYAACAALDRGEAKAAAPEVDVLRQEQQKKKNDRKLEQRLWEVQGRLMCQEGSGDAGLKLLQRAVDKTKDNYSDHAWGHGAYFMEQWGIAGLEAGDAAAAEEAFLEALAHDAGSARGALGMMALCDRLGRADEARRFEAVAARCWSRADRRVYVAVRDDMVKAAEHVSRGSTAGR